MRKLTLKGVRIIASLVIVVLTVIIGAIALVPEKSVTIVEIGENTPLYNGSRSSNKVALMINVYEGADVVRKMMDTLEKHGAKSTFFVGGCYVDDNSELLVEIINRGHELGNHGYFHLDHKKLNEKRNTEEIENNHKLVKTITNYEMTLFAPPSGSFGNDTLKVCEKLGYKSIMWTKDTIDWRDHDKKKVFERATKNISGGDFVLMHPKQHTLNALDDILNYYEGKGICAVTVSECIKGNDL